MPDAKGQKRHHPAPPQPQLPEFATCRCEPWAAEQRRLSTPGSWNPRRPLAAATANSGRFLLETRQLLIYRRARRVRVFRRCHRDPCTSKDLQKVVLNVANLTQLQERCHVAPGLCVFTSRSCTWRLWPERGLAAATEALGAAWQEEGAPRVLPACGDVGEHSATERRAAFLSARRALRESG